MKIKSLIFCLLLFFPFPHSSGAASLLGNPYTIAGKTMGTFYTIKFISHKKEDLPLWKRRVKIRLKEVSQRLSMYDPKGEVSRFNKEEVENPLSVSRDFFSVLLTAEKLFRLTDGAWDGTVKPLVDLWGFGTGQKTDEVPAPEKIAAALAKTGFEHIMINEAGTIHKTAGITLDLGSIAKGYGVDAIAALFGTWGIRDILVEIGGELYASGENKKNKPWVVGINTPDTRHSKTRGLYEIIRLTNQAVATSGNYRNYFEVNNRIYSHIIDPATGFPVDNGIVSASVVSTDCTFADGLATALMVMDIEKGIQLVNRIKDTECLIILQRDGRLKGYRSRNFHRLVVK